ncbi:hypothetical protein RHGRI_004945 [Rhododendron griersonianum]|uniref:Uncharacterized protein n=1 Tax=Rhododendron griersonianum TaxID=479676 RepID=A0AAV6LB96_9ERIC|nr:hypothetical protein RHGRI_004945 [Rhododendron griersonianum]
MSFGGWFLSGLDSRSQLVCLQGGLACCGLSGLLPHPEFRSASRKSLWSFPLRL